jgi:enterochelin esterase-like enzyme
LDFDGGRRVTVYVPSAAPEAVAFAGDGQVIAQWGGALEAADVPPVMIVGAHRVDDEMLRLHEYSPAFDAQRFAAHERFFVEEVRQWARSRFAVVPPAERTAVFGVSAGAELALAMRIRHPDVYGAVLCASPGAGYRPPAPMPDCAAARVPRGRHARAVLPGQRDPVGASAARRRRGRRHDRTGRSTRRRVLEKRVPLMVAWAFGR